MGRKVFKRCSNRFCGRNTKKRRHIKCPKCGATLRYTNENESQIKIKKRKNKKN